MLKIILTGATTIILAIAVIRAAVQSSKEQSSKSDDKFIYTLVVATAFTLMSLGVI